MATNVNVISEPSNQDELRDAAFDASIQEPNSPAKDDIPLHGSEQSAGSRNSRTSVQGEVIDVGKMDNLWKAVHIVSNCLAVDVFAAFMVGLNLSYVLNDMVTGDSDTTNSESQMWYTACASTKSLVLVVMSQFATNAGSWWGRKRVLTFAQFFLMLACFTSLFAVVANLIFVHVIAAVWQGSASGDKASTMAYIADVSTAETHKKNGAWLTAWCSFGLFIAMVFYLALPALACYALSGVLLIVAFTIREIWLPDWSPPKEKRSSPSWSLMFQEASPCNVYKSYVPQTSYVKCLLWTQFSQYGSLGALHAYFANYVLVRFGMEQKEAGLWVATAGLLTGLTMFFGLWCLPVKSTFYLMWTTPLFALYITMMGARHTMWTGFILYCPRLIPLAQLDILYYGQLSARRRHELASLENMAERLGYLAGSLLTMLYSPMWIDNYQNGDQSYPAVPVVSLLFDLLIVLIFYTGTYHYKHLDMYGKFFMVLNGEADFPIGCKVRVKGLDEGSEHNGAVGVSEGNVATDDKSTETGSYRVRLENDRVIEVKPANLELCDIAPEGEA